MISVILGAMGAHLLKESLLESQLASFETAVRYLMYHSLALLFLGLLTHINTKWISRFFIGGIILFSGSIFLLSTQNLTQMELGFLGPVTPLGGMLLITAWTILIYKLFRYKSEKVL